MFMSLFVMAISLTSCSSDDDEGGPEGSPFTSINLTGTPTGGLVGDEFTFTVTDNNNNVVTADAVIKANGTTITSPHTFTATGNYEIIATYSGKTSNALNVIIDEETSINIVYTPNSDVKTKDLVNFSVYNNLGNNVSSNSTLSVDGTTITSPHQFPVVGDYVVTATYTPASGSTLTASETISVTRGFTKKILLEDYTGTWCQYCPGAAAAIATATNTSYNILTVGYHVSYSSTQGIDPMQIPETVFFAGQYGVNAFPTVFFDGPATTDWNYPNPSQLNSELAETATTGLALDAEVSGNVLNVEVKVGFTAVPTEELKLMLYLVEDNVTTSTPQSGTNQGANYVHKDVLREVYTNQLGDVIPAGSISLSADYTQTFTGLTLPSNISNMSELKVIAFVRKNISGNHYKIMNVQEAALGETKDFD